MSDSEWLDRISGWNAGDNASDTTNMCGYEKDAARRSSEERVNRENRIKPRDKGGRAPSREGGAKR